MGRKIKDIAGKRFGKLVVVRRDMETYNGEIRWECACDCGNISIVRGGHLHAGKIVSCGCKRGYKHGYSNNTLHNIWKLMRSRCRNKNNSNFKNYGGRGITVCERWNDFTNFLADVGERPFGLTIDRIDNDGNYEPGNVRWATRKQQNNNKRRR